MKKKKYAKGGRTIGGVSARLEYLTDAIGSDKLYDDFKSKTGITSNDLKDIDAVAFAYTDYGGDFLDRVAIAYFAETHPNNIVREDTSYGGENAIVFGDVAKEYMEATENDLLGFEDMESAYYEIEQNAYYEMFTDLEEQLERDGWEFDKETLIDYLIQDVKGRYSVQPSGQVDYSESDLINELWESGIIDKPNKMAKGGQIKTSNREARKYVENLIPFKGANLEGRKVGDAYVVISYGYYPVFVHKDGQWYENSNRYSMTTAKQMSQARPYKEVNKIIKKTTEELKALSGYYEDGGNINTWNYSIGGL